MHNIGVKQPQSYYVEPYHNILRIKVYYYNIIYDEMTRDFVTVLTRSYLNLNSKVSGRRSLDCLDLIFLLPHKLLERQEVYGGNIKQRATRLDRVGISVFD